MPLERITGSISKRGAGAVGVASLRKFGFGIKSRPLVPPTATGADAISIGEGSAADGLDAIAIGQTTDAGHQEAIALGLGATSRFVGDVVWGWQGGVLISRHDVCMGETAINNDTPTNLQLTDGSEGIPIGTSHIYGIKGQILGKQTTSGNAAYYTFECIIKNIVGTVTIPFSNITEHLDETVGVAVALVADNINKKFQIEITGLAATAVRWSAEMRITHIIRS